MILQAALVLQDESKNFSPIFIQTFQLALHGRSIKKISVGHELIKNISIWHKVEKLVSQVHLSKIRLIIFLIEAVFAYWICLSRLSASPGFESRFETNPITALNQEWHEDYTVMTVTILVLN